MSDEMNSQPTPEAITLDPASNDDALRLAAAIRSVCDIDGRWDAAEILQALAVPPLPEEPPAWTLVASGQDNPVRVFYRVSDRKGMRRPWHAVSGGWHTWAEVCAAAQEDSGGTPEVLEPESVKALRSSDLVLREQTEKQAAWIKSMKNTIASVGAERDDARATVDQIRAEFRKAFTVDFGGWDWRDDDAIQTLARALSRLLSAEPVNEDEQTRIANGDDEPPALEAS